MKFSFDIWNIKPFSTGLEMLCLRAEQATADQAEKTATATAGNLGTQAAGELGQLNPFLSREMHAEHGFDPSQMNEMLTHAGLGAGAEAGNLTSAMERNTAVTGNAAGGTKALQELGRDRMKTDAGTSEGVAAQDVLGAKTLNQQGAQGMQGLYGENLKGQLDAMGQVSGDINAAVNANKTGYLQQQEDISNTVSNAFASCPVEGSLYLMADGTERPVETLSIGDSITGIDDEPQTIEDIRTVMLEAVEVHTDDGFVSRSSNTHAFALPYGGFVVARQSLGKAIKTAKGVGTVVSVTPIGRKKVYSVITEGSHTYRADGVWALGSSEGELTIPAKVWEAGAHA